MANYEDTEIRHISAEDFKGLSKSAITILDLREPDEVLIHPIEGAINIPFSKISQELKNVPSDKPVYVICRTGDFSEEVTEILTDREYDATNVDGGYDAYKKVLESQPQSIFVDAKNLRCPGPS